MEGRFNGRFIALPVWGAYTWTGLFSEFYGILVVGKYRLRGYHDWGTFSWVFTVIPREIEDINAYPKFWGGKEGILREMCKWQIYKRNCKGPRLHVLNVL